MKLNINYGDDVNHLLPMPLKDIKTIEDSERVKNTLSKSFGILNSTLRNHTLEGDVKSVMDSFEDIITNRVFCRGIFVGDKRKNINFMKQQIISLDIDGTIKQVDPLLKILIDFKIAPNFIYSSVRDNKDGDRKIRIVYILPNGIPRNNTEDLKLINGDFSTHIGGDPNTKDFARLFFPGKEILYRNDKIVSRNEILINNIKDFIELTELGFEKDERDYYESDRTLLFLDQLQYTIEYRPDFISGINLTDKYILKTKSQYQRAIFHYESDLFKVTHVFFTRNVRYTWDTVKGLMLNLKWVRGGSKRVIDRMIEIDNSGGGVYIDINGKEGRMERYGSYIDDMRRLSKTDLVPMNLKRFSPFKEDHIYKNLLEHKHLWGWVINHKDTSDRFSTLEDSENIFSNLMNKLLKESIITEII